MTPTLRRVEFVVEVPAASAAAAVAAALADPTNCRFSVVDLPTGHVEHIDHSPDGRGTNPYARRQGAAVPRSLRPGGKYRTRDGREAWVTFQDQTDDVLVVYPSEIEGEPARLVTRHKSGRVTPGGPEHPHDIVEVNPFITRWVRLYDRKLNDAGKQVVGGKEWAAERGLFLYVYDTEEAARADLRGVRAVFPMTYHEGEGLG